MFSLSSNDWRTHTLQCQFSNTGYHSFDIEFNSSVWDWYIVIKHLSEWMILFAMLWILHDPGDGDSAAESDDAGRGNAGDEYWEPAVEDANYGGGGSKVSDSAKLTGEGQRLDKYGAI